MDNGNACPYNAPLTLFCNASVYCPHKIGKAHILFGGTKVLQILTTDVDTKSLPFDVNVIDLTGLTVIPGIVDPHVHATGGGGEKGPASRTPEAKLEQLIEAGITCLVGVLGTDSISRSLANLLTKVRALEEEGLTTYMWTGAYRTPPPTLTNHNDSVQHDVVLIDKVLGFGEIAISDHRSSHPTFHELARIVGDTRVAGMISGKSGKTHFHLGGGPEKLDLLWEIVNKTPIPISQMYPTHVSGRGPELRKEGIKWLKAGGTIDLTCGKSLKASCLTMLNEIKEEDQKIKSEQSTSSSGSAQATASLLSRVTISSDAYGSLPKFDKDGKLISYDYARPNVILTTVQLLVESHGWPLEEALPLCTRNTGDYLNIQKGVIQVGRDADIVVLDTRNPSQYTVQYVVSKGQFLKVPNWTKRSLFQT